MSGLRIRGAPRRIDIYDSVNPPVCSSCGTLLDPLTRGVSFYCPNCGVAVIWRCNKCRGQVTEYTCPNCGFTGP